MAEPIRPTNIEALIEGGVSGQVAVGSYNVQIHADHGAVVHFVPPDRQPKPSLRPAPVSLLPRPFRGLLDRQSNLGAAAAALQDGLPVELHGPPGIGKSSLLRHLAHESRSGSLPDGVVHLAAQGQPAADLLQSLFEAFYECDRAFKPTDPQVRHALQGRRALVLLDDVALGREEAEALLDAAPGCSFILASQERCLWGEARAVALGGLPTEDSLALFERELGRALTAEERTAAADLCSGVECHPLRVLQAAALAKEDKRSLAELAAEARSAPSPAVVNRWALDRLSAEERRVVAILAGADGAPVGIDPLREIAGPDADRILDKLLARQVVQAHSPRYSLRVELDEAVRQAWQVELWQEKLWERLTAWAERNPGRIHEEAASLRQAVDSAAAAESWETVRRLGRAIEGALAVTGRWGAWGLVIERVLAACERLRNVPGRAWALHQRGTRSLCLGDLQAAREDLTQALQIRESIGDVAGAAVTRHNLGLLLAPPPTPSNGPAGSAPRGFPHLLAWMILPALLILLVLVIGGRTLFSGTSGTGSEPAAETPAVTEDPDSDEESSSADQDKEEEPDIEPAPTSTPVDSPETTDLPVEIPVDLTPEEETPTDTTAPEPPEPVDTTEPEPVDIPEEPQGWCCLDGKVTEASETVCQESQGMFFMTRRSARLACAATRAGCCVDGVFKVGMSADECARLEGTPMTPIEAPFRCKPREEPGNGVVGEGWCCINQDVFPSSADDCKRNGGGFGRTEREAARRCTTQGGGAP